MRQLFSLWMCLTCLVSCAIAHTSASESVANVESIYADVLDAYGAFSTIDSGLMKSYEGKDRQAWERIYREKREALVAALSKLPNDELSRTDARAAALMRAGSLD